LREEEEDDLPEPETPRAVVARMKIVNERLRQRWMSGRCCEYRTAREEDEKCSFETAGAILNPQRSGSTSSDVSSVPCESQLCFDLLVIRREQKMDGSVSKEGQYYSEFILLST
jgi:hypothetical protein